MSHIMFTHRRRLAFAGVVAFALGSAGISVGSATVSAHPSELAGEVIETTSQPDSGLVALQLASSQQSQVSQQECQQEIILFPVQDVYVDLVLPHQEQAQHQQHKQKQQHHHQPQQHHQHQQQQSQCFTGTWVEIDPTHRLMHPAQAEALLD